MGFLFFGRSSSPNLQDSLGNNCTKLCRSLRLNPVPLLNIISELSYEHFQTLADFIFDVVFADCTLDFDTIESSQPFLDFCLTLFDTEICASPESFLRSNTVASKLLSRFFSSPSINSFLARALSPIIHELSTDQDPDYIYLAERVISLIHSPHNLASISPCVVYLAQGIRKLLIKYRVTENRRIALFGAFVFLRYVNPGLLFSNFSIKEDSDKDLRQKKVKLCKVLQLVANTEKTQSTTLSKHGDVDVEKVKELQSLLTGLLVDLVNQEIDYDTTVASGALVSASKVADFLTFCHLFNRQLPKNLVKFLPSLRMLNKLRKGNLNTNVRLNLM
ncbi:hypothetical protein P9112_012273 [Eukaryota sp. TZLM1-RC]